MLTEACARLAALPVIAELARELRYVIDKVEELEIKTRVHKKSTSDMAVRMREELKTLLARRDELKRIVEGAEAPAAQAEAAEGEKKKKPKKDQAAAAAAAAGSGAAALLTRCLNNSHFMACMCHWRLGAYTYK